MRTSLRLFLALMCYPLLAGCNRVAPPSSPVNTASLATTTTRFQNVTERAGFRFSRVNGAEGKYYMPETMGGGGAFVDYDNDGYLDVLLVNGNWWKPRAGQAPTLALYHNNKNGTFTDVTKEMGLAVSMQGMGVAVGDYDNDGYNDLVITGVGGSRLFHNEQGKGFRDVTAISGAGGSGWCTSAVWLDYDKDGKLDLFVCHYARWTPETDIPCTSKGFKSYCRPQEYPGDSCRLYHNEGGGRFKDTTKAAGIWNENAKALGVVVHDLDGDGNPDIVVANDMQPNYVFHNNGNGTFKEIGFECGIALSDNAATRAGMGIDIADYKNDGTAGLAIGNFSFEGIGFYPIGREPSYAERSKQVGTYAPSYPYITFGLLFADFDNDGWTDLFFTNGHIEDTVAKSNPSQTYEQPSVLLQNRGDGKFSDVSILAGAAITQPIVGRGACYGDFDNDGKVDILLIPNRGAPRLLHNESQNTNHYLCFKLTGKSVNRNAYGAKITLKTDRGTQTRTCRSGGSYLSANDSRVLFGLGADAKIESVTVSWGGGKESAYSNLASDKRYELIEGEATAKPIP